MARYKLLDRAYCKRTPSDPIEQIHEAGTEIETADNAVPGPHMEPIDTKAREAMERYRKVGAPLDVEKVRALNEGVVIFPGVMLPAAVLDPQAQAVAAIVKAAMEAQADQTRALIEAMKKLAA